METCPLNMTMPDIIYFDAWLSYALKKFGRPQMPWHWPGFITLIYFTYIFLGQALHFRPLPLVKFIGTPQYLPPNNTISAELIIPQYFKRILFRDISTLFILYCTEIILWYALFVSVQKRQLALLDDISPIYTVDVLLELPLCLYLLAAENTASDDIDDYLMIFGGWGAACFHALAPRRAFEDMIFESKSSVSPDDRKMLAFRYACKWHFERWYDDTAGICFLLHFSWHMGAGLLALFRFAIHFKNTKYTFT